MIPLVLMWLRAAGLVGQSLVLGGAAFALVVLPLARATAALAPGHLLAVRVAAAGALVVAVAELGLLACLAGTFADATGWLVGALLGTTVGAVGLARATLAAVAAGAAGVLCQAPAARAAAAALAATAVLLPVTSALVSHATSRPSGAAWLVAVGALHQAAVGTWVGGLACAVVLGARAVPEAGAWLRVFSRLATGAVVVVAATGIALAVAYVPTPAAAIGTSYGVMVLTKVALFGALLVMGGLNHRAVRAASPSPAGALLLRRRLEVEAGLALVTILLAASIGSAPPAADAGAVPTDQIRGMLVPRWPRLHSPTLGELAAGAALNDRLSPRAAEDIAWSEFGHNVAGLFIIVIGTLVMLEQSGWARWARHWPLLFIGLTAFVAYSMDPEGWQTGIVGFWSHLLDPEVLQHKILLCLTALFGLGEWRLRNGGRPGAPWAYLLPVVSIASGIVLISHTHLVSDAHSAFFMEVSHLAMGLISLLVGWARWLELRLPAPESRIPGRVWGPALAMFGVLLVLYRES